MKHRAKVNGGGGSSIINMASTAALMGYPMIPAYTAAKGAIRSMTRSVAIHCQDEGYGIRCNALAPGGIETPMVRDISGRAGEELNDIPDGPLPADALGTGRRWSCSRRRPASSPARRCRSTTGWTPAPITEDRTGSGAYRWYVLALLTLTSTFSVADRLVFGILVEDIKAEFALSDFELGLLGGLAFSIIYVIAGFPAARLADRSVRKNIVAVAIAFWSLMTALCGLATGFWTLFLARTGVGVGEGCSGPASQSLVADYFRREELAKAMGFLTIGAAMGTAGGLGGQPEFGWRWAFVPVAPRFSLAASPVRSSGAMSRNG